jgi:two-component system response regulator (stage 0 sporulation protein F)
MPNDYGQEFPGVPVQKPLYNRTHGVPLHCLPVFLVIFFPILLDSCPLIMASILIIDDNELVRGFLRTVLEGAGHTVVEASQGREGFQHLHRMGIDMVLTDIYMPDCDGLEVIMTLRRDFPKIKVLAMTGESGDKNLLMAARKLGASQVLTKPFTVEMLLKTVESTLAGTPQSLA